MCREHLLVMVVVEESMWLPWPPGLHHDARVIHHTVVVVVDQRQNERSCDRAY